MCRYFILALKLEHSKTIKSLLLEDFSDTKYRKLQKSGSKSYIRVYNIQHYISKILGHKNILWSSKQ